MDNPYRSPQTNPPAPQEGSSQWYTAVILAIVSFTFGATQPLTHYLETGSTYSWLVFGVSFGMTVGLIHHFLCDPREVLIAAERSNATISHQNPSEAD